MAIALNVSSNVTIGQNNHYLNAWCDMILEDRWHFNQCAGAGAPIQTANDKAGGVYLQKEREYIARHLEGAALRMANDLNYWINPAWFSETIPIGKGRPIANQIFQARYCKMIALGSRATALIQANVPITYSDPNQTGVNDTATVTVNTTVTNSEVRLYFRAAEGAPKAGDYRYEIEPLQVTDSAGVVTLKAHRSLFVKPTQWAREYTANDPNFNSANVVDTSDVNAFVGFVDVYRVYTDQSANIQLLDNNLTVLQTYTGYILDAELSAFRMGYLCSNVCGGRPAFIRVNYYAGSPLVNSNIDSELFEACVAMASADMDSILTKMSYWSLNQFTAWHRPMVESMEGSNIPIATQAESNSPYGVRTGQIKAWRTVLGRRIEKGLKFLS